MALPGLISIQFAEHSTLYNQAQDLDWAQAMITADGVRYRCPINPTPWYDLDGIRG